MPRRARRYAGNRLMSWPWKVIRPPRRGRRPMMLSMVVVFPAPLRPTRQTDSFSPTVSDTCRRIWAWPRYVLMPCSSSMGGPEHRVLHGLVPPDLFRAAAGEDLALMHDHDAVGVFEDDVHVVLDDDRGDLVRSDDRADDVHDGRLLPGAHAAGGLVEKEELRLQSVGDGYVEQLALALRDDAGQLRALRLQPELAEDLERLIPHLVVASGQGEEPARHALAGEDGERHVVVERKLVEEVHDLEAPRDAGLDAAVHRQRGDVLAAEHDTAAVGIEEPADQVHHARLARAVGADQRQDLAFLDLEVDIVDGVGLAEGLAQLLGLQEVHGANRLLAAAASSRTVPTIPVGSTTTRTTRTSPSSACQ